MSLKYSTTNSTCKLTHTHTNVSATSEFQHENVKTLFFSPYRHVKKKLIVTATSGDGPTGVTVS